MINRIELYEADGTLITRLPATSPVVTSDRQLRFRIHPSYLQAMRQLGRQVRAWDGIEPVFVGFVSSPRASVRARDTDVQVTCQDRGIRARLARFSADSIVEGTVTDSGQLVTAASATTELAANAAIQAWARVIQSVIEQVTPQWGVAYRSEPIVIGWYQRLLNDGTIESGLIYGETNIPYQAQVGETAVTLSAVQFAESGSAIAGTYQVIATGLGAGDSLRVQQTIDLGSSLPIAEVTATTDGTATLETSTDGTTYAAYAAGTTWRYLRVTVERTAESLSLALSIKAGAVFAASNVLTDTDTQWRADSGDSLRQLTVSRAAAASANVAYVRVGDTSADKVSRYAFDLDASVDGVAWTPLGTFSGTPAMLIECPFIAGSYAKFRLTFKTAAVVRFVDVRSIVAQYTVPDVIRTWLQGVGEAEFDFPASRVPVKLAVGERGEEVEAACQRLAATAGMRLWHRRDGYATLTRLNDYTVAGAPLHDAPIEPLEVEWLDDLYNEIIGVSEPTGVAPMQFVARDDDAASPTGIPRIGKRTAPVRYFPEADTAAKLEQATKTALAESLQRTINVQFTIPANPTLEPGTVVHIINRQTGLAGVFVVDAFEITAQENRYNAVCRGRQLA